jgi:drug/metabolite transporter (DMT)-like permease
LAAGVVMAAIPATVAVMSRVFLGESIGPRVLAAIACAAGGMALLAWARGTTAGGDASAPWWGYALLLGAVFCEASYVVIGKRLSAQLSPRRISALINLWGLLLVTPLGLWQAAPFDFSAVSPTYWGMLAFYAVAASMWSVWLWMRGLVHVPASRAGVFTVMLPLTAGAVGVLVLGESFTSLHALAMALAIAGLLLATWPTSR